MQISVVNYINDDTHQAECVQHKIQNIGQVDGQQIRQTNEHHQRVFHVRSMGLKGLNKKGLVKC